MRELFSKVFQFLFMDREFANRVDDYNYGYLWYYREKCREEKVEPDAESFPYYICWSNPRRIVCYLDILAFIIPNLILAYYRLNFHGAMNIVWIAYSCAVGAIFSSSFFMVADYYAEKRLYGKVVVVRFRTKKMLEQFDDRSKRLCAIKDEYCEKKRLEMAEIMMRQAEEKAKEAAEREQSAEYYKNGFKALAEYVETAYGVSTPDLELYDGKFTLVLPAEKRAGTVEYRFERNEEGLQEAIMQIADMDYVMRKRTELRQLVARKMQPIDPGHPEDY